MFCMGWYHLISDRMLSIRQCTYFQMFQGTSEDDAEKKKKKKHSKITDTEKKTNNSHMPLFFSYRLESCSIYQINTLPASYSSKRSGHHMIFSAHGRKRV